MPGQKVTNEKTQKTKKKKQNKTRRADKGARCAAERNTQNDALACVRLCCCCCCCCCGCRLHPQPSRPRPWWAELRPPPGRSTDGPSPSDASRRPTAAADAGTRVFFFAFLVGPSTSGPPPPPPSDPFVVLVIEWTVTVFCFVFFLFNVRASWTSSSPVGVLPSFTEFRSC